MNDDMSSKEYEMSDLIHLIDITNILIDKSLPYIDQMELLVKIMKDPYHFRVDDTPVFIQYKNDGVPLENLLKQHLRRCNHDR